MTTITLPPPVAQTQAASRKAARDAAHAFFAQAASGR